VECDDAPGFVVLSSMIVSVVFLAPHSLNLQLTVRAGVRALFFDPLTICFTLFGSAFIKLSLG